MKFSIFEFVLLAICSTVVVAQSLPVLRVGMNQTAVQSALASCCTLKARPGVSGGFTVFDKQGKAILWQIDFNSADMLSSVEKATQDVTSLNSIQLISLLAQKLSDNCREVIPNNGSSVVVKKLAVPYPTPQYEVSGGIFLQCGIPFKGTPNDSFYNLNIQSIPTDTRPGGTTGRVLLSESWFLAPDIP